MFCFVFICQTNELVSAPTSAARQLPHLQMMCRDYQVDWVCHFGTLMQCIEAVA